MARNLDNMKPEELAAKVDALSPVWAKDYIRRLEGLTRTLHAQLQAAQPAIQFARSYSEMTGGSGGIPDPSLLAATLRPEAMGQDAAAPSAQTPAGSVWIPSGITPPDGDYATIRVLDGTANMEPVADLSDRHEVRFTDFYQVLYGAHEITGGMRVLVIEGDQPIVIHPAGPNTVLISRADQAR